MLNDVKYILKTINNAIAEKDSIIDYYRKHENELKQQIEELKKENQKLKGE